MTIIGAEMDLLVGSPLFHCMTSAVLVALFEFLYLCPTFQPSTDRSANTNHVIFSSIVFPPSYSTVVFFKYLFVLLPQSLVLLSQLLSQTRYLRIFFRREWGWGCWLKELTSRGSVVLTSL